MLQSIGRARTAIRLAALPGAGDVCLLVADTGIAQLTAAAGDSEHSSAISTSSVASTSAPSSEYSAVVGVSSSCTHQPVHNSSAAVTATPSGSNGPVHEHKVGVGTKTRILQRQMELSGCHNRPAGAGILSLQHAQQQRAYGSAATSEVDSVSSSESSSDVASAATTAQQEQEKQQQPQNVEQPQSVAAAHSLRYGYGRSPLESSIIMCGSLAKLQEVLQHSSSVAGPQELLQALNRTNKLNKVHRSITKQRVKVLQSQWQSLQPLNEQQQQQLAALQQQHEQHEQDMQVLLALLVRMLQEVEGSLGSEQLVQVLACLAALGVTHLSEQSSALLVFVLQRLNTGLSALQPRHLATIATALGQLHDADRRAQLLQHDWAAAAAADEFTQPDDSAHPPPPQQQPQQQELQQGAQAAAQAARLLVPGLCEAVRQYGALMDPPSVANFVAAMGRLGHYDWATMTHIASLLSQRAPPQGFNSNQVAKLLVGFTKLRHYDAALCMQLAAAAERDMHNATGAQMAQIVWALGQQRFEQPGVFEAAAMRLPLRVMDLQPRHVSLLSWAFAVRKAYSPTLYDALAGRMVQLLAADRGGSTSTSSSSSSSSSSNNSSSSRLDSLFLSEDDVVLPHHLSLVAWSFAKQGHKHEVMMQAVADRIMREAGRMLPQNISNAAWGFGRLGVRHPAMFGALSAAAKSRHLEGYNSQNITDLAWGFTETGNQDPELFQLIAAATSSSLWELSPHSLNDLIWAFATARDPQATKVLGDAAPAVVNSLHRFSVGMLADTLWAYAAVGLKDDALLAAAAQVLPARLLQLEPDTQSQAKVIWAMRQLNWRDADLEKQLGSIIPGLEELLGS